MNAEQAWDHFVQQVMNVAGGIEEPTRAIAAGKLYAAHAVAEARAPLVEALRSCLDSLTFISKELGSDGRWKVWSHPAHSMAQARAALAKEGPDA